MTRFATTFNAPSELLSSLGSKTGISLQSVIHDIMICQIYINWDASLMKISREMVDWFRPEGRDYVEFFWSSSMKSQMKLRLVKCVRINMEKSKVQEFFPRIFVPDMQINKKKIAQSSNQSRQRLCFSLSLNLPADNHKPFISNHIHWWTSENTKNSRGQKAERNRAISMLIYASRNSRFVSIRTQSVVFSIFFKFRKRNFQLCALVFWINFAMRQITLLVIALSITLIESKIYLSCELAKEFSRNDMERHLIPHWICLVQAESQGNTSKVVEQPNLTANYGIFQVRTLFDVPLMVSRMCSPTMYYADQQQRVVRKR